MASLQVLRFQKNRLTGDLSGLFGGSATRLQNVDFSDNRLSGSVPVDLFELPDLLTVALTLNCFVGTLPARMCAPRNLTVLSMDGLGAASNCKHEIQVPFTGVVLDNALTGTIPECVWTMPQLQVLHLTGNGELFVFVCLFCVAVVVDVKSNGRSLFYAFHRSFRKHNGHHC
jgi:hypothetical protein